MKKSKKLTLHRETLRSLAEEPLAEVAGGLKTNEPSWCIACSRTGCFVSICVCPEV